MSLWQKSWGRRIRGGGGKQLGRQRERGQNKGVYWGNQQERKVSKVNGVPHNLCCCCCCIFCMWWGRNDVQFVMVLVYIFEIAVFWIIYLVQNRHRWREWMDWVDRTDWRDRLDGVGGLNARECLWAYWDYDSCCAEIECTGILITTGL